MPVVRYPKYLHAPPDQVTTRAYMARKGCPSRANDSSITPAEYDTSSERSAETATLEAGAPVVELVKASLVQAPIDKALTTNSNPCRWFITRADCPLRNPDASTITRTEHRARDRQIGAGAATA